MTELNTPLENDDLPEAIVEWEPRHGPLIGRWDGPVVAIATVSALALLGLTAGAYLAGRAQGRKQYH
ncbi:MAG TPA: hypothetical protein VK943_08785 [Arenibaculum sp.]|nr:hypothetical protein [Arenibaculum sp.]